MSQEPRVPTENGFYNFSNFRELLERDGQELEEDLVEVDQHCKDCRLDILDQQLNTPLGQPMPEYCWKCSKNYCPACVQEATLVEESDAGIIEDDGVEREHTCFAPPAPPRKKHCFILHHRDCDGYAAGAIAYTTLSDAETTLVIRGVQYGEPFPDLDIQEGDSFYCLDFSYDKLTLLAVQEKIGTKGTILVLDHHESARDELEDLSFAKFDMTKSGALLAWEHFVPEYPPSEAIVLLDCYDLWNKKHPEHSWEKIAAFQMACASQKGDLSFWFGLVGGYYIDPNFRLLGQNLYADFLLSVKHVKEALTTEIIEIDGQRGIAFFCENEVSLMSDALYTDPEINVSWSACFIQRKDNWVASMRSKTKDFPVLPFAKKLGGGGHPMSCAAPVAPLEGLDATDVIQTFVKKLTA